MAGLSPAEQLILEFMPLVEGLAERYSASSPNEYDDLRQEGMIAVWLAHEKGLKPTEEIIGWRMSKWLRRRKSQDHGQTPAEDDELYLDDAAPGKSAVLG